MKTNGWVIVLPKLNTYKNKWLSHRDGQWIYSKSSSLTLLLAVKTCTVSCEFKSSLHWQPMRKLVQSGRPLSLVNLVYKVCMKQSFLLMPTYSSYCNVIMLCYVTCLRTAGWVLWCGFSFNSFGSGFPLITMMWRTETIYQLWQHFHGSLGDLCMKDSLTLLTIQVLCIKWLSVGIQT